MRLRRRENAVDVARTAIDPAPGLMPSIQRFRGIHVAACLLQIRLKIDLIYAN